MAELVGQWLHYEGNPSRIDHRTGKVFWHSSRTCTTSWCGATPEDATRELVLPPSEGEHHDAGAGATDRSAPASAPQGCGPTGEFTAAEYDAIVSTIWNDLDSDPRRFDDLLTEALTYIVDVAVMNDTDPYEAARATAVLRSMEQRALWGPNHEQEDHR